MPLPTCMRCGGTFLPPRRATWWNYCPSCSADVCDRDPWTVPDFPWDAYAPVPDEPPERTDIRGCEGFEEMLAEERRGYR